MHQGEEHWVAHIAAIPVGLPLDLDGLVKEGQAGGCQGSIGTEFGSAEDLRLPSTDVCGGNKQLDAAGAAQALKVHLLAEEIAQWVQVEGVELVR
jgi:hypothetical protein